MNYFDRKFHGFCNSYCFLFLIMAKLNPFFSDRIQILKENTTNINEVLRKQTLEGTLWQSPESTENDHGCCQRRQRCAVANCVQGLD